MQEACLTVEENTRLKSRLQAAEAGAVQRQATSAEQDYEEVIQLLEAEIRDLKNQLAAKRQACGAEAKVSLNPPFLLLWKTSSSNLQLPTIVKYEIGIKKKSLNCFSYF